MLLQSIRERLTGVLAFVILGILIIPFALVGVTQYFTNDGVNIVAKINDTEITTNDFNQSFSNFRRRMQSIMGDAFDPVHYDQLSVRREHLDNLIDQELISQAAESMGLDVDDDTLASEIRNIPGFQVDGQFNPDVYQSRLQSQGMSPRQFEGEMRKQFVVSQLPQNITASSLATPLELDAFVALRDQGRTFAAVMVPVVAAETAPEFGETEIQAWYESNTASFQSEEQVSIEYIELDAAFLPVGEPPEEDYLREQFDSQKGRFLSPEQRMVSHILIEAGSAATDAEKETARQIAEDLSSRANGGEDFATLAKENSQDSGSAATGGDLGWVEAGVMVKAFENAMYELSMDSPISGPVETGFGWHVIQLREIRPSTGKSFEEARMQLVTEYEEEQAERAFLEQADRLVDLIYEDPTTLDSAALVLDLKVDVAGPFTRAGGQGVAANPDVVRSAFSDMVLLQGTVSDPVNLDENHLVMIRLKEHFPVALKPLADVRDEIIATLTNNLALDLAESKANELLAASRAVAGSLEELATAENLEYSHHESIKRNSFVPEPKLVGEIFKLQAPADSSSTLIVLPTSSGYAVVDLESVTDGVLEEGSAITRQQYERVLANSAASQEAFALMRRLRSVADIEVYEDRIQ